MLMVEKPNANANIYVSGRNVAKDDDQD